MNGAAGNFLATAEKLSTNGFRRVLEIDTLGSFNMSQQVFKQSFKPRRQGVIINIGASLHWAGSWAQVHSAGAKAANDSMTKVLAVEWGPYGVRVNELVPGSIEGTEGFERLGSLDNINNKEKSNAAFEDKAASGKKSMLDDMKTLVPVQRFGTPSDIANAALFLASPASSYVSGTKLVVDGGSTLTMPNMVFGNPGFVGQWAQAKM